MNHYPRHVGDYLRDTVDLTMLEDGAYTRLLDQYYARDEPLPADKAKVYRMARAFSRPERAACGRTRRDGIIINVDHIKPRKTHPHLALEPSNLQVLCNECNLGKGNKFKTDWRR